MTNDYLIRRKAVDFGIPLITNIQLAQRFVEALERKAGMCWEAWKSRAGATIDDQSSEFSKPLEAQAFFHWGIY